MPDCNAPHPLVAPQVKSPRLSYKFQRLREQLRTAILNGEFADRLPGERELGRRYGANAKTVNKALSDLSSEGLLARHIGRGTFLDSGTQRTAPKTRGLSVKCFTRTNAGASQQRSDKLSRLLRISAAQQEYRFETVSCGDSITEISIGLRNWPAATRRRSNALFFIPTSPLMGSSGQPAEDLIIEAHRRRTPAVLVGAAAQNAKLNAVVPDYVEAGFRLADHLLRLGCDSVVVIHMSETPEVQLALNGCRTACARHHVPICNLLAGSDTTTVQFKLERLLEAELAVHGHHGVEPIVGVVTLGSAALDAVFSVERAAQLHQSGEVVINCLADGDEESVARRNVSSYDFDQDKLAAWAFRLAREARPGARPAEIIVPGALTIRSVIPQQDTTNAVATSAVSRGAEQLVEAVL